MLIGPWNRPTWIDRVRHAIRSNSCPTNPCQNQSTSPSTCAVDCVGTGSNVQKLAAACTLHLLFNHVLLFILAFLLLSAGNHQVATHQLSHHRATPPAPFCPAFPVAFLDMPNHVLSDDDKRAFIRDGYIVVRGAIPSNLIDDALAFVDDAYAKGQYEYDETKFDPVPVFAKEVTENPVLGELLERSAVLPAMEDLLGEGNVKYNHAPQIAFRTADKKMRAKGMGMTDLTPWFKYHIDGGQGPLAHTGTPFSLLVGVCLSPGQDVDENRGQFTAWPGSHFKLHRIVRQRVQKGLIKGHQIFGGHGAHKPNVGTPRRVLLNPGDVVLAHQRLGHAGGVNLCNIPRKNLYFRVRRVGHYKIVDDIVNGPTFHQFDGLHHLGSDIEQAEADALQAE